MPKHPDWFKFYVNDFENSRHVKDMNAAEQGVYVRCFLMQWRDGSVPDDPVKIARYSGLTLKEVRRAWPKVRAALKPQSDGSLVSERLLEERLAVPPRDVLGSSSEVPIPKVVSESTKHRANVSVRASESESVSSSGFEISQTQKNPEPPTRAREVPTVLAPRRAPVADAPSFHAFWERYRKLRDAGRQQIAAQMWLSYECEEHVEQVCECLTSYERSRDVANGTVNNCEVWLRAVFDSGFTARWPGVRTKRSKLEEMMEAV